jgi:putative transposase
MPGGNVGQVGVPKRTASCKDASDKSMPQAMASTGVPRFTSICARRVFVAVGSGWCGSCSKRRRFQRGTTQRNPSQPVAPNRLQQQFTVRAPNQVWLADITYVPTAEGWLYLAVVLDLFSRCVLGWAMDAHMTESLVHRALRMAIAQRGGLVRQTLHHSDRGSQYTSADYQALLAQAKMTVSMSGAGNCYDNAPMESFFSLLKTELVHHHRYATRHQAKTSIFDYIEVFYNRQRLHSGIGYLTPLAAEQQWQRSLS